MSVDYSFKDIGEGLALCEITDEKFKSFAVSVKLMLPFDISRTPLYSLAMDVLASCSARYPERDDLSRALTGLYSASLSTNAGMIGNYYTATMSLNCICDSYTIGKERVSDKAVDILLGSLYEPLLENGLLSAKYLEQCRADMLDDIDSVISSKMRYAAMRSKKFVFRGELAEYTKLDERELVAGCTVEDVTRAYYELLDRANILLTVVGGRVDEDLKERIAKKILSYDRHPIKIDTFKAPSPIKPEVCRVTEEAQLNQCKLLMAYKTESYNEYASKLMCTMLGSTPFSKLFVNVREKLSLCYYCSSVLTDNRNTMLVNSGLDEDKLALAEEQINAQLAALASGDFTDDEMENAKLYLADAYLSNLDSKYDIAAWYHYQYINGTSESPQEKGAIIKTLTREDIMKEAAGYRQDTVYVLRPQKGGAANA